MFASPRESHSDSIRSDYALVLMEDLGLQIVAKEQMSKEINFRP